MSVACLVSIRLPCVDAHPRAADLNDQASCAFDAQASGAFDVMHAPHTSRLDPRSLQVFSAIARDVISRLQAEQSRQDQERGVAASPMKMTSSIDTSGRKKPSSGGGCC